MAEDNVFKRYLDAGAAFSQMTQQRAETIVRDLVKAGEVQTEQAQAAVADVLERSRGNTERLVSQVRREVRDQVSNLGLATKADIARIERQIASLRGSATRSGPARTAPAKKSAAKKSAAKRSTAKRSTAKRSPAKKSAAKKSTAKRSTAKRSPAKKSSRS